MTAGGVGLATGSVLTPRHPAAATTTRRKTTNTTIQSLIRITPCRISGTIFFLDLKDVRFYRFACCFAIREYILERGNEAVDFLVVEGGPECSNLGCIHDHDTFLLHREAVRTHGVDINCKGSRPVLGGWQADD